MVTTKKFNKNIDHTGGVYGGGLIRGCAIATVGEALGHNLWIDRSFLQFAQNAMDETDIKASFNHDGGLGSALGTWDNATIVGDKLTADISFYKAAADSPMGNLVDYIMRLAAEDPSALGVSIVGERDADTELAFRRTHTKAGVFTSPDAANAKRLTHIRLARLVAADLVDRPAANPSGLFSSRCTIATFRSKPKTAPIVASAPRELSRAERIERDRLDVLRAAEIRRLKSENEGLARLRNR